MKKMGMKRIGFLQPSLVQTEETAVLVSSVAEGFVHSLDSDISQVTTTTLMPKLWGWVPSLSLTSAFGLLLVALAYSGTRTEANWVGWTELLFWGGLSLLFMPIAARLLSEAPSRRERISLVILFGIGLYFVKVLRYPVAFAFHDEFLHWRTTSDIFKSGQLFSDNPILPISTLFPGLEIITSALVHMSGLSVFSVGIIVIGVARLVLVLALFLFYEQVSGSNRVAGLATLLYMTNPKLIFFDAQFAYESLALPLAAMMLFMLAIRSRTDDATYNGLTAGILLVLGALTITHHVTSYVLTIFLILWRILLVPLGRRFNQGEQANPRGMALLSLTLNLAWMIYVATLVVKYLVPNLTGAANELLQVMAGEMPQRELFRDYAGELPPLWERWTAFAATLIILAGLAFGLYHIWQRYRTRSLALVLAVLALAHPASLAFRLTKNGGEAADRAAGTLFIAIAFVLAVGAIWVVSTCKSSWRWSVAITGLATIIFVGNVIIGAGPRWSRMPGPYLVSADSRSIEPQGIAAAIWIRSVLGPDNRIATDRINRLLMASYGEQRPVTHTEDGLDVSPLFFALGYGRVQQSIVQQGRIHYVVVDRRLSTALPRVGIYFEAPEPDALQHTTPIDPAALAKFDRLSNISRLFDSGSIVIYEIGPSTHEP